MGNGNGQLNVAHSLATDAGDGDLDAAAIADDVFILDALILPAGALVIANRAENLLAEEAAWLGLEGAVVDRLGILHLAARPVADGLWRCDGDGDAVEGIFVPAEGGAKVVARTGGDFIGLDAHDYSLVVKI